MVERVVDEPPSHKTQTSSEDARAAAAEFLINRIGNQAIAGEPHLMISAFRSVWIVPIQLAYLPIGSIGSIGVVDIDDETGRDVA